MRLPSGVTDQYIYFVAVDATDFATRETGLSSFTVYRSRNGAAATVMTTPTINETDSTNMPGVYELLCDEDMTIDSGDDSQAMVFHITHAGMAPVTLALELYRVKVTAGETLTVLSGVGSSNVVQISGDSAAADNLESYCDGTTPMPANVTQLSSDATAADNAEAFFDGTGYAGTNNVIPSVTTVTGNVNGSVASVSGAVGSVTGNVGGNVTGSVGSVTGSVGSIAAGGITASSIATDAIDADALAADAATEIKNAVLTTQLTESYATDGSAPTLAQAIFAIQQFLQERSTASTTVTVKKLDGSTTAMTFTLDDATTPTSITRSG